MRVTDSGPAIAYPDPLVVYPPEVVLSELAEWRQDELWREEQPRFRGPLAPDAYHKEDVTGGPPYEIELPDPSAGAWVLNVRPPMTFVAYLRHVFAWAGLPGYAEVYDEPPLMIAAIAADLLPL